MATENKKVNNSQYSNLYSGPYLHSHINNFLQVSNALSLKKNYSDVLDVQIKVQQDLLNKYLKSRDITEEQLLSFLRNNSGAEGKSDTESAFNEIISKFKKIATPGGSGESESQLTDAIVKSFDTYLSDENNKEKFQKMSKTIWESGADPMKGSISLAMNEGNTKYINGESIRNFKQTYLPLLAKQLDANSGISEDELKSLFVGYRNSLDLMSYLIKLNMAKRNNLKSRLSKEYLSTVENMSYDTLVKSPNVSKYIAGLIGESIGFVALQIEDDLASGFSGGLGAVTKTGTKTFDNAPVKSDLSISYGEETLNVSVKNMGSTFDWKPENSDIIQQMNHAVIDNGTSVRKMIDRFRTVRAGISNDTDLDILAYFIINFVFFNKVGSVDSEGKVTKISQNQMSGVKDFIKLNINAYTGILMGTYLGEIKENSDLMSVGILYDPMKGYAIPVYKILEKIKTTLSDKGNSAIGVRSDISFSLSGTSTAEAKNYYSEKLKLLNNSNDKDSKDLNYPKNLYSFGVLKGQELENKIAYRSSISILNSLLKESF